MPIQFNLENINQNGAATDLPMGYLSYHSSVVNLSIGLQQKIKKRRKGKNLNSSLNLVFVFQLTCVLVCFHLIEVDVHLTRIFVAAKLPPGKPQFNLCKSFLQSEAIFLAKFLCLKLRCSALTLDFRHSSYPSKWPTCQLGNHNSISENLGKIQTSWQAP